MTIIKRLNDYFFKLRNSERGVTLPELMVALGISGIITYCVCASVLVGSRQLSSSTVATSMQDSGRSGLSKMSQEIRASSPSEITISNDGNSITFKVPPNSNALNVDDYSIDWDAAAQVTYEIGGTNNRQLMRRVTGGADQVIANDVTDITFSADSDDPSLITAALSLQRTTEFGRLIPASPLQMDAEIKVRNGYSDDSEEEAEAEDDHEEDDHEEDDDHGCDDDDHGSDHDDDDDDDDDHGSDHDDH